MRQIFRGPGFDWKETFLKKKAFTGVLYWTIPGWPVAQHPPKKEQ